jgi:two-component system LytT family response regulator
VKAIALDDEPFALDVVRSLVAKVPFVDLQACFTDAFEALDFLQRTSIDLLFIDIRMPDISGLEFVSSLPKKPLVIFTTAYAEHAVTGFELDAVDYLLKPFSLARLVKACNKARELQLLRTSAPTSAVDDYLFLKIGYEQVKVRYDEIHYLEAAGNYVTFVLATQRLLTRLTVQEALALLPQERFTRVLHVEGASIPVGTSYLPDVSFISTKPRRL